jgi:HEAT repeat protein
MQDRLARELSQIRDPATLPALLGLLQLSNPFVRTEVLQAVRAIHSPQSADALLRMLDDPNPDNGFVAMQGLIEISDHKGVDWVPSWPVFNTNQKYYAAKCREWWEGEKKQAQ